MGDNTEMGTLAVTGTPNSRKRRARKPSARPGRRRRTRLRMRRAKPGNQRPKRVRPPGAVVLQVDPQSAAERAGLKPGDLVTELDGTPVRDAADLQLRLALLRIGEVAEFAVSRPGGAVTVRAAMAERAGRALQMMPHQESASETAPRSIYDPGGQHHWGGQRRCSKRLVQCGECVELRSIRGFE